jgi:hypothetical protein
MRPQPADDTDPIGRARAVVEAALTGLLRTDSTPQQDHDTAQQFLAAYTPELAAALSARAQADGAGGFLDRALGAISTAIAHIRAGHVLEVSGELIAARGALIAASPPASSTRPLPVEVCDLCELAAPRWALPLVGATPIALSGTAPAMLLACPDCLRIVVQTRSDDELAELLGVDLLSRSLRGLHARIVGPPTAWPGSPRE